MQHPTLNSQLSNAHCHSIRFRISGGRRRKIVVAGGLSPAGNQVGGDELIRVVVRQANFDKIAHKIDKMGDYKPEIVYEKAQIKELDPAMKMRSQN